MLVGEIPDRLPLGQQDVDIRPLAPAAAGDPAGQPEGQIAVALGSQRVTNTLVRPPTAVGSELGQRVQRIVAGARVRTGTKVSVAKTSRSRAGPSGPSSQRSSPLQSARACGPMAVLNSVSAERSRRNATRS